MTERLKKFLKCIILFFCLNPFAINAQILKDTTSLKLIKKGIDNIYNMQFDDATAICRELSQSYPEHPVIYVLKGMITYWENYPLLPTSPAHTLYEKDMRSCIEICEKAHNEADDSDYLLANLSARGMLLMFYADNDLSMEVLPLAASTYKYIRHSFGYTNICTDFHFFTGLYNYYREAYPEAYPVYKALAFLFPKGDRSKGMEELQGVAKNSILYKAESYSFLSIICLSFEDDFDKAYSYSKSLNELYPTNVQYLGTYIKNLLLVKHYDEAEELMISSDTTIRNPYYQAQLSIFNGIIQEKKYHNIKLAEQYYNKGVRDISFFGHYGNEYAAYGYFGLSRTSNLDDNKNYRKAYRKKAIELADFKKVDFDD